MRLVVPAFARFAAFELALWASLYGIYLAGRGLAVGEADEAVRHAAQLVDAERAFGLFHEASLQQALGWAHEFFSAYYMLGFAPLLATVVLWLGWRDRPRYRELRTLLLVSIAIALVVHVVYPAAPPRLVPDLGIADTVGLASHDTGSFAGVRFNPYAAMPSMHVGWSLLLAVVALRAFSRPLVRNLFAVHPVLMIVTVSATGNHYFVDSLAGAAVAGLALVTVRLTRGTAGTTSEHLRAAFTFRPQAETVGP